MNTPSDSTTTTTTTTAAATTPLQLAFAAIILGASAGLTLYTKRTSTMLQQMERASKNAMERKGPHKKIMKTK